MHTYILAYMYPWRQTHKHPNTHTSSGTQISKHIHTQVKLWASWFCMDGGDEKPFLRSLDISANLNQEVRDVEVDVFLFQNQFLTCPKWSRIIFGTTHFGPIFDAFIVPEQPIFKPFWDFRRATTGHREPTTRQKQFFWHFMWSRIIVEKSFFFFLHPVDLVDPFWHPPLWVTSCSLPQPTGPRYGGLSVG